MSRSGYGDDCEYLALYRGAVDRAIAGKRGQSLLREALSALDTMPVKALVSNVLVSDRGHCLLGVVGEKRGLDLTSVDEIEPDQVGRLFDIAPSMAAEIAFVNDECGPSDETDEQRFDRVRHWVVMKVKP